MTRFEDHVSNELCSVDAQLTNRPATSGTEPRLVSALSFLVIFNILVIPTPNGGGISDGTPREAISALYHGKVSALGMEGRRPNAGGRVVGL
jgi:hypothetical protein